MSSETASQRIALRPLVLLQHAGLFTRLRRWLVRTGGRIVYKLHANYLLTDVTSYGFDKPRLDAAAVREVDRYVNEGAAYFYRTEMHTVDIERLSQYYPYRRIEARGEQHLRICNIGSYYAGADAHFLEKNPGSTVYGLDFGNIAEINADLKSPCLRLHPGYPLETLERLAAAGETFDYAFFIRTAVKINIEQLLSYMDVLSRVAKNVIFLEVAKLSQTHRRRVDVSAIDLMRPMKLYGGMYLHNYPRLLAKYGYGVVESAVLPASTFPQQSLTPDHDFVYLHGRREL